MSATFVPITCRECGRVFDLTDEADAEEWAYGHDCEAPDMTGWNTCRNCDRVLRGNARYCSNVCEDMDAHPAPRDIMETLTNTSAADVAGSSNPVAL